MALSKDKVEKTQAELDKEVADKKAAQDLLDKEAADKKAAQDKLDKEAADKKAAQDLLDKEAADALLAKEQKEREDAEADLRRRQALVDQENLDNAAKILEAQGLEAPPVKKLVEIYNPRNADFRQYSTGTWIMAKQTAWLLEDGWLENQLNAKLLERV